MTPPEHGAGVGAVRGPVDLARLIWAARSEASRLHRLAVDSAQLPGRPDRAPIEQQDARVYRCPGCGDWRYDVDGARRTCSACGHHRKYLRRTA